MSSKQILVPIDFSAVSLIAVEHAHHIASHAGADITLLHLVDHVDELPEGERNLEEFVKGYEKAFDSSVGFHTLVKVGEILTDIGEEADAMKAFMVVMGTHGVKGMQFILGSNALHIVSSTQTPFVIVHEEGIEENGYDNIIVPLDLQKESKQKLMVVAQMAKFFKSTVHLIIPFEKDEFLHNALQRNLKYAEEYFEERAIVHTQTIAPEHSHDIDEAIDRVALEKNGDLIAIMNWSELGIANLFSEHKTSRIINNEHHIPVLVVNPRSTGDFDLFGWPAP